MERSGYAGFVMASCGVARFGMAGVFCPGSAGFVA